MQLLTRYITEKAWVRTSEKDALRIIAEEIGDADPQGVLTYVLDAIRRGGVVTVGTCRFKLQTSA